VGESVQGVKRKQKKNNKKKKKKWGKSEAGEEGSW
jgi:hypothetical protein